jgi:hypothetical protein
MGLANYRKYLSELRRKPTVVFNFSLLFIFIAVQIAQKIMVFEFPLIQNHAGSSLSEKTL